MPGQPQVAPEPKVLGELEEAEVAQLQQMRKAASDIVHQIGNMEVQKARLMGNLSDIEVQSKGVMDGVSERLGLAEGVRWQIQENKIIQVGMPPQPPVQAVPEQEPEKAEGEAPAEEG